MLNPAINSRDFDEISPKVSPDGKTLFFTRIGYPVYNKTLLINGQDWGKSPSYSTKLRSIFQSLGGRNTTDIEKSDFNQDIWYATSNIGVFDNIMHADYPINNALPNSVCSFSADGESIYVINQFGYDGGMQPGFSKSHRSGLNWNFPSPLDISDFYTKQSGVHMSMSEDEAIVVMSLMRDDSFGGTDLYVSFRKAPGKYTVPVNLGPDVNTEHNEEAPFICSDNKTMYFSSDRPGIYGGKDIYKSIRQDVTWESWEEPYALYEPINSNKDDNQPFYHSGSSYLYFVSNREVSSDIYRVSYSESLQEKDPPTVVYTEVEPGPVKVYSYLNGTSAEAEPTINRTLPIQIVDASNGAFLEASVDYSVAGGASKITSRSGKVSLNVSSDDVFLTVSKNGFVTNESLIPKSEVISRLNSQEHIRIELDAIVENGRIRTDQIFFHQSRAAVRKDSYRALDKLVSTLKKHWNVSIMIQGHTDDQGDTEALQLLSEERAKAVKEYLVLKGISPLRISTDGMGGSQPLNDNSTDELRKKNRRVEIIISKVFKKPNLTSSNSN